MRNSCTSPNRLPASPVPEQVLIAEVDGNPVGFSVTLPDLNEAIRPLNGRLTKFGLPIGLVRLLFRMRKIKTARVMVLVLLEAYRRRGIAELLIFRTLDYGASVLGYTAAELGWTLEDNTPISRTVEAVGSQTVQEIPHLLGTTGRGGLGKQIAPQGGLATGAYRSENAIRSSRAQVSLPKLGRSVSMPLAERWQAASRGVNRMAPQEEP